MRTRGSFSSRPATYYHTLLTEERFNFQNLLKQIFLTWVKTCTIGKRFSWFRRGFFRRLFVSLHVEKRAKSGCTNSFFER